MHDMNLEKNRSKIQTAYKVSPFTKGTCPETEDAVKRFESRYTPIPAEYRWLLLNFGGCYLAEPWTFTLKELEDLSSCHFGWAERLIDIHPVFWLCVGVQIIQRYPFSGTESDQIGRASCRERVCLYV